MKNIHLLPTDKPSRLAGSEYVTNVQGIDKRAFKLKLWNKFIPNEDLKDVGYIPQHIYITSEEKTLSNNGDYYLGHPDYNKIHKWNLITQVWINKIVLTTDDQLIADGVQAIDDEFLEWFVKNANESGVPFDRCEVKSWTIDKEWDKVHTQFNPIYPHKTKYKIIIPQEEPKKETLEEAAWKYASEKLGRIVPIYKELDANVAEYVGFIDGAKWQMYALYILLNNIVLTPKEWREQYKKK